MSLLAVASGNSNAQDVKVLRITENPTYVRAVRFRNIQSELLYVDTMTGALPLDDMPSPPTPAVTSDQPNAFTEQVLENVTRVLLLGLTALLVYLVVKYGWRAKNGLLRQRLNGNSSAELRAHSDEAPTMTRTRTQELIAKLLDMEDREAALVELVHHILSAAADQNELRLGRSETARDFLQRLPRNWPPLTDMRRIIIAEELVQFGGRPLVARTFEDCLRRATPILDGKRA